MRPEPLRPGATIGIVGGGQLARMLAIAAARLGFRTHIFAPDADAPAFQVAAGHRRAAYDDASALDAFAAEVDVITYEFENLPAESLQRLAARVPVHPPVVALETAQDRLMEKRFLAGLGIATAPFAPVDDAAMLAAALAGMGGSGILKTRRFGYDGKGQVHLGPGDDPHSALEALGHAPAILEGVVPFTREISVVAARGQDGEIAAFPPVENRHENGILRETIAPAAMSPEIAEEARRITTRILDALDYVGAIGVEMFLLEDEVPRILVNEIAPRVHNSGHWTLDAAMCDQFEQHIRAVAGLPLGDASPICPAVMCNLIGAEIDDLAALLAQPGTRVHHYGKGESRPGRKMGHVTRLTPASRT
jgi:5-(carboxyamino)imidazole ribonucleotide synthase